MVRLALINLLMALSTQTSWRKVRLEQRRLLIAAFLQSSLSRTR